MVVRMSKNDTLGTEGFRNDDTAPLLSKFMRINRPSGNRMPNKFLNPAWPSALGLTTWHP